MEPIADSDEVVSAIDQRGAGGLLVIGTTRPFSNSNVYQPQHGPVLSHNFPIVALKTCPSDPSLLVTISDRIRVWKNDSLVAVLDPHDASADVCPFTAVDFFQKLFAVTDVSGHCSVWSVESQQPLQVYSLGEGRRFYDVCFVSEHIVACVSETGALFVVDRRSHTVVCSELVEAVPSCQPCLLKWQGTQVLLAHQTAGTVHAMELCSLSQAAGPGPKLVGSSSSNRGSIAAIAWVPNTADFFVLARDSDVVEVWNVKNLNAPYFEYSLGVGKVAASVFVHENTCIIGTTTGELVRTQLPSNMRSDRGWLGVTFDDSNSFNPPTHTSYPALG